ncbi:FimV/HubP family polar landmark protein, partial [Pseudoalteromonas aurantia]
AVADEPEQPLEVEVEVEDELDVDPALESTAEGDFEEEAVVETSERDTQSADEEINLEAEEPLETFPEFDEQAALDAVADEPEQPLEVEVEVEDELDVDPALESTTEGDFEEEAVVETSERDTQSADEEINLEAEEPLEAFPEFDEQAALDAVADEPAQPLEVEVEDELDVDPVLENIAEGDFEEEAVVETSERDTQSADEEINLEAEEPIETLLELDEQAALDAVADESDQLPEMESDFEDEELIQPKELTGTDAAVEAPLPANLADAPELEFESADHEGDTLQNSPDEFLSQLDELSEVQEAAEQVVIDEAAIENEFMANLSDTDFDSLLNDMVEPEPVNIVELDDVDVDFASLLNDEPDTEIEELLELSDDDEDQFVDIDDLLSQSDDLEPQDEPYDDADMDVGLGDFDEFLAGDNATDVDLEADGFAAKLDLARAYIEIEDYDGAMGVIKEVLDKGPESVQSEAQALQSKLIS